MDVGGGEGLGRISFAPALPLLPFDRYSSLRYFFLSPSFRCCKNQRQAESLLIIMVHNEHNHVIIRERLRDVERNDEDASKPVARHFILHNHSKEHIAVCGLSLHLGSSESRKHENKNLPSSLLIIPTVSTSAFHSTNSFLFSHHHTPTNNVAPFSAYKPTHNAQFLQSL